jgi:hypothetical protein
MKPAREMSMVRDSSRIGPLVNGSRIRRQDIRLGRG